MFSADLSQQWLPALLAWWDSYVLSYISAKGKQAYIVHFGLTHNPPKRAANFCAPFDGNKFGSTVIKTSPHCVCGHAAAESAMSVTREYLMSSGYPSIVVHFWLKTKQNEVAQQIRLSLMIR